MTATRPKNHTANFCIAFSQKPTFQTHDKFAKLKISLSFCLVSRHSCKSKRTKIELQQMIDFQVKYLQILSNFSSSAQNLWAKPTTNKSANQRGRRAVVLHFGQLYLVEAASARLDASVRTAGFRGRPSARELGFKTEVRFFPGVDARDLSTRWHTELCWWIFCTSASEHAILINHEYQLSDECTVVG